MKNKLTNMKRKNAGFTLLELVVVVAVMGLISSMAMDVYTDNSNQKRFEATKQRLTEIKFAIIGDPQMRVGSQAVLSGFFKDMERYPRNVKELTENLTSQTYPNSGLCITNYIPDDSIINETTCTTASGTWVDKTDDKDNWKGPYIHSLQSSDGTTTFVDAWGVDFNWAFNNTPVSLQITSYGLNRISGGSGYEADQTLSIHKTQFDSFKVVNALPPATSPSYCINTTTSAINFGYTDTASCTAVVNHIWIVFP